MFKLYKVLQASEDLQEKRDANTGALFPVIFVSILI